MDINVLSLELGIKSKGASLVLTESIERVTHPLALCSVLSIFVPCSRGTSLSTALEGELNLSKVVA